MQCSEWGTRSSKSTNQLHRRTLITTRVLESSPFLSHCYFSLVSLFHPLSAAAAAAVIGPDCRCRPRISSTALWLKPPPASLSLFLSFNRQLTYQQPHRVAAYTYNKAAPSSSVIEILLSAVQQPSSTPFYIIVCVICGFRNRNREKKRACCERGFRIDERDNADCAEEEMGVMGHFSPFHQQNKFLSDVCARIACRRLSLLQHLAKSHTQVIFHFTKEKRKGSRTNLGIYTVNFIPTSRTVTLQNGR